MTCEAEETYENIAEGDHRFEVQATDPAGNTDGSPAVATWTVDLTAPDTSVTSGPPERTNTTSAAVRFASSEPGSSFECRVDGAEEWTACASPLELDDLAEGDHIARVRAIDEAGNVDAIPDERAWVVDLTAPETTITSGPAPVTTQRDASFAFASSEPAGGRLECALDSGEWGPCSSPASRDALSDGGHVFRVRATDAAGNTDTTDAAHHWRVDTTAPTAAITADANPVVTGDTVSLSAEGSGDPDGGTIVAYQWDLDGDGTFESDTGATPQAAWSYATHGPVLVSVRTTDAVGHVDVAGLELDVRPSPPPGEVGVSIDAGGRFTNSPTVAVALVWPRLATEAVISNDGGFANATTIPVGASVPWTLDSSGSERLPKTIYVRFRGTGAPEQTFQDDIILDQTSPTLAKATIERTATASSGYRLRVRASDETAGLSGLQVGKDRDNPGPVHPYAEVLDLEQLPEVLYVRVFDAAGNTSAWQTAGRPARGFGRSSKLTVVLPARARVLVRGARATVRLANANLFAVRGTATLTARPRKAAHAARAPLARGSFTASARRKATIRLRLTPAARRRLRRGPLRAHLRSEHTTRWARSERSSAT